LLNLLSPFREQYHDINITINAYIWLTILLPLLKSKNSIFKFCINLKNMIIMKRINLFLAIALMSVTFTSCTQEPGSVNLFNGNDLTGWHWDVPSMDNDPELRNPFIVRNGLLVTLGTPLGHLITDSVYQDYRLEAEYRFSAEPGNCGILVHASTPRALYNMFPQSIEVQMMHENAGDFWCIVEDIEVPEMEGRRGPKEDWGIVEGKSRRIHNLSDDSENPVGEWNTMVIECLGDQVKVWVNNDLVNHGFNATATKGQIAIQAEGSEVEFRKLLLTPISQLTE